MLNINIEVEGAQAHLRKGAGKREKKSLKQYLLEKMRTWIDSVLEAERDEFLGRGRYAQLDEAHDNYRNGYRHRVLNFFGLGKIELKVPRDRKGEFESAWLPERTAQDRETEAFLAEAVFVGSWESVKRVNVSKCWRWRWGIGNGSICGRVFC